MHSDISTKKLGEVVRLAVQGVSGHSVAGGVAVVAVAAVVSVVAAPARRGCTSLQRQQGQDFCTTLKILRHVPKNSSTPAPYPGGVHRRWATAISSAPTGTRRPGDSGIRIGGLNGLFVRAKAFNHRAVGSVSGIRKYTHRRSYVHTKNKHINSRAYSVGQIVISG